MTNNNVEITKNLDRQVKARSGCLERAARGSAYKMASCVPANWLQWLRSRSLLKDLFHRLSINCVVDVGANCGQYGMTLRSLGYSGPIISFEPVKATFDTLRTTAKRHEPWEVFPYALGATAGTAEINVTESSLFSSLLLPDDKSRICFPGNKVSRTETVQLHRLDEVASTCLRNLDTPRIYLKLDTQGYDLEVLKGTEAILPSVVALQTEVSFRHIYNAMHDFTDSISEFRARGFEVVDFMPVSHDIDGLCAVEMDCIMARRPKWQGDLTDK